MVPERNRVWPPPRKSGTGLKLLATMSAPTWMGAPILWPEMLIAVSPEALKLIGRCPKAATAAVDRKISCQLANLLNIGNYSNFVVYPHQANQRDLSP